MAVRRIDDIEREKHEENRARVKEEITGDINEVIGNIFPRKNKKRTVGSIFFNILKIIGVVFLIVIILDILLGSVWLLKFFVKSLFFGG